MDSFDVSGSLASQMCTVSPVPVHTTLLQFFLLTWWLGVLQMGTDQPLQPSKSSGSKCDPLPAFSHKWAFPRESYIELINMKTRRNQTHRLCSLEKNHISKVLGKFITNFKKETKESDIIFQNKTSWTSLQMASCYSGSSSVPVWNKDSDSPLM